ncbi:hypothetical protein D3C80_1856660 [compost metagenome]
MVFSAAITTVLLVALLYIVPVAPAVPWATSPAGSGVAVKPLGKVKVNLPPSIDTFCAGASPAG